MRIFAPDGETVLADIPPCEDAPLRILLEQPDVGELSLAGANVPVVSRGVPAKGEVERVNNVLTAITQDGRKTAIVPTMLLDFVKDPIAHVIMSPDTGPASVVREESGRISGVRRLVRK